MKLNGIRHFSHIILSLLMGTLAAGLTSCHAVWQEEPVCDQGLAIRFVYDYNMEDANAFPSQVHCLTVIVYDAEGRYVTTVTETDRAKLSDENWRLRLPLPEGSYRVVAYGGLECEDSSFDLSGARGMLTDRRVALKSDLLTSPKGKNLHPLFYGISMDEDMASKHAFASEPSVTTVGYNDADLQPVTVYMMKDTNNVRILLHNSDGSPINDTDFRYTITDNNTLFDWNNTLLPSPTVTYWPWTQGTIPGGSRADGDDPVGLPAMAYAEISTSRFVTGSDAVLRIEEISSGRTVLRIPLVDILLQYKSANFGMLGNQEFLDRRSEWELSLFLDATLGGWYTVTIWIEDWYVRINNIEQ
ncbi:MAG: FimB/Mfa2 family fimbrial subunit [Duncaniella sp.]|nr:FimB/Mfa2 family fimbrial subunit [Duncaniella sp.]